MPERRWRVAGRGRGLFAIEVDDGSGFRPATAAEVDAALRQRELFGAAEYPSRQRVVDPVCPRRGNGHLWRFDRERSTCGLARRTCARHADWCG